MKREIWILFSKKYSTKLSSPLISIDRLAGRTKREDSLYGETLSFSYDSVNRFFCSFFDKVCLNCIADNISIYLNFILFFTSIELKRVSILGSRKDFC